MTNGSQGNALVLGGAGFLGGWLVKALVGDGVITTVVDDLSTGDRARVAGAKLVVGAISELDLVDLIKLHEVDVVFHLATASYVPPSFDDPLLDLQSNAGTTVAVLEAARHSHRAPLVVAVSSAAVYGDSRILPMDEDHPTQPMSPYGVSKWAAEEYMRLYHRLFGVRCLVARPFSLYGPGQRKQVVYDLLTRAMSDEETLTILGDAKVTRDFVFVEDAARALLDLSRLAPAAGEAYNLASGSPTSLGELVEEILSVCGVEKPVAFTGSVRPGDPLRWEGDPARARALGVVCGTPLSAGLRQTLDWVRTLKG